MATSDERREARPTHASDPRSGLQQLVQGAKPTPSRAQVVVGLVLAVVGFLAVVQVQSLNADDDFAGARREDLITLLDTLEGTARRAREEIDTLEARRNALQSTSDRRSAAIEDARNQVEVLSILAGTAPAVGAGIQVTVADPYHEVAARTLINALQEMRNAGAEAIELNNRVRVVADTALTDIDGGVAADGVELRPPYVLEVIGSPTTLETAMTFPGGLTDEVAELRGSATVRTSERVEILSLHTPREPQYARPAPD